MYGNSEKLGAVLVIERRRCRGRRRNELGELEPCGAVYDVPSRKLAQLYKTPLSRTDYSIEAIKEPSPTFDRYEAEQPVTGKHRTVYIQESYCDWCQLCYRPTIEWDTVHALPVEEKKRELLQLETPEAYSEACSRRDRLRNELTEAKEAAKRAVEARNKLLDQYHLACDTVHACARYYYDRVQHQYVERPSTKLNASAKVKPMKLTDI